MYAPPKLRPNDHVRVIAPSSSGSIISEANIKIATKVLNDLDIRVSFGRSVFKHNNVMSTTITERLDDLHEAFSDPDIHGILTVIGGYNSNELLPYIDYSLIRSNPKIFCGYSDITALQNAFLAKSNLITYSGPHFSSFAMRKGADYLIEHFKKVIMDHDSVTIKPSSHWSEDAWYIDQETRHFIPNSGPYIIQPGKGRGRIIGGNLPTLSLLFGTPYVPDLSHAILFIESDSYTAGVDAMEFTRDLHAFFQQPHMDTIQGLVLGRFERKFDLTRDHLREIIRSLPLSDKVPVIADLDFGHTMPFFTFPIGGKCDLNVTSQSLDIILNNDSIRR